MRLFKMLPVVAIAAAVALGAACAEEGAEEEGTELTPADTAMTTPPPATDMDMPMDDTMGMMDDTLMMGDTTAM